jgi:DNA-binding IscR family transcriptional regulator
VNPCAIHNKWKTVRNAYLNLLQNTTIADLLKSGEPALLTAG